MTALVALLWMPGPLADVPFEHVPGRIWLKGALNGEPVDAALDSGASGLFALEDAAQRARGTKGDPLSVEGIGEGTSAAWRTRDLRFSLPGTSVEAPVPYILAPAYALPGRKLEVAAGFDFLLRYAAEIDYASQRLRLFNPWTYRPAEGYRPIRVRFVDRRPVVDAELEIPGLPVRTASVLFDTGFAGGLELSRKFALSAGLDDAFGHLPTEPAPGGLGGPVRRRRIGAVRLRLGGLDLSADTAVSMAGGGASGPKAQYDVLLGDAALRRFDLTFDYWHGRIYLRPRPEMEK